MYQVANQGLQAELMGSFKFSCYFWTFFVETMKHFNGSFSSLLTEFIVLNCLFLSSPDEIVIRPPTFLKSS